MRETAGDEQRYTEQQRQYLPLARKGDSRGHDESTAYGKQSATQWSYGKASRKDALCCILQWHRRQAYHQRHEQTAHKVAAQDGKQGSKFTFLYEACCTRVELEGVVNDCEQSEGKEHSANDVLGCQVSEASGADAHTSENRRA